MSVIESAMLFRRALWDILMHFIFLILQKTARLSEGKLLADATGDDCGRHLPRKVDVFTHIL